MSDELTTNGHGQVPTRTFAEWDVFLDGEGRRRSGGVTAQLQVAIARVEELLLTAGEDATGRVCVVDFHLGRFEPWVRDTASERQARMDGGRVVWAGPR